MSRTVGWFSAGAASAVAMKLSNPDIIAYCETGSEDEDNERFLRDVEQWLGREVLRLRSDEYESTWDVWEKRQYIAGNDGAPCTGELKVKPRLAFQEPDDLHIFGYTSDKGDVRRAKSFVEHWPDLAISTPLIDRGINKAACLAMIRNAGITPPRVYEMGYPNANCIPCCKATSPDYYAMVRHNHPSEFERFAKLCRKLDVRAARIAGERVFVDEIPGDWPMVEPIAPECDFLCSLAEEDMSLIATDRGAA